MAQTVIGFFENNLAAYKAVEGLTARGFYTRQIEITREDDGDATQMNVEQKEESGFTRFFKNLFGDTDEAKRYAHVGRSGCTLVTIYAQSADEARFAASLLDDFGALDVDEHLAQKSSGNISRDDFAAGRQTQREAVAENQDKSKTRIRSRIVEDETREHQRLHENEIRIEQNPIDQAAAQNWQSFEEGRIELTERKEVPLVNKEARVVEEINVRKVVEEHDETINENLRHTEVDVEKLHKRPDRFNNDDEIGNWKKGRGESNPSF